MNEYFEVGKIFATHGLKGEVKVYSLTDFPEERFAIGSTLYVGDEENKTILNISAVRKQPKFYLIKFEQITDIDQAEKLIKKVLYVARQDRSALPDGSYYFEDIIGTTIFDINSGEKLGILNNIETPGANDIWEIKPDDGKNFWIPNIAPVVKSIDLDNNKIEVELLEGLKDEN